MLPDGGYIILIDAVVLKWPRHGRAALNPKELLSLFIVSSPTLLELNLSLIHILIQVQEMSNSV